MGQPAGTEGHVGHQRTHAVVIVGAGFAGIGMAIRLRRAGIHNFVILEKAMTGRRHLADNTYPGCACDVRPTCTPLLRAQGRLEPRFAPWPRSSDTSALRRQVRDPAAPEVRHRGVGAEYDEQRATWRWRVRTAACARRAVVSGRAAHVPTYPCSPGWSCSGVRRSTPRRWDHSWT